MGKKNPANAAMIIDHRKELVMRNLLEIGAKVKMNDNYYVSEKNKSKIWVVKSMPWVVCGEWVILLEGLSGCYAVNGLDLVEG